MFKLKHFPGNPLSQYLQSLCSISKFSPPIKIEFTATPYFNLRLPVVEDNWVMGSPSNILRLFDSLIIPKYLLTICRSMISLHGPEILKKSKNDIQIFLVFQHKHHCQLKWIKKTWKYFKIPPRSQKLPSIEKGKWCAHGRLLLRRRKNVF